MYAQRPVSEGSFDAEYQFGQPQTYLAPIELVRLTILRSRLGDTRTQRKPSRSNAVSQVSAAWPSRVPPESSAKRDRVTWPDGKEVVAQSQST
jgi:hypothetical protein